MIDLIFNFLAEIVFFQIGRLILRVVSFGRLEPTLDSRHQPLVSLLGGVVSFCTVVGIGFWLHAPAKPQPGHNLFDTRSEFQAYVARLDLSALPTITAIEKLTSQGFSCDTFKDGNVACFREARGTLCGERQFVDLLVPGKDGAAHTVSTRFGRVCL